MSLAHQDLAKLDHWSWIPTVIVESIPMRLKIPYETAEERGVFLELEVAQENLVASFEPQEQAALPDIRQAVSAALEDPIGSKKLSELLAGAKRVTIITENQFRQAPTREILPVLMDKAR